MPGDPNECRERAKRCLEIASQTTHLQLKDSLTDIAHQWIRLATELEATRRLLDEWGDPRFADNPKCVVPFGPRKRA
jgi:hypothetical protein